MEKRRDKRHHRRFPVRYGTQSLEWAGFTTDISSSGMFVVGSSLPGLDERVHLEVTLPHGRLAYFEGIVARLVDVPVALRPVKKAGFGVRFLSPAELVADALQGRPEDERLRLVYPDARGFAVALEREFRHGGVFCWSARRFAVGTRMPIDVEAGWSGVACTLEVTVSNLVDGAAGQVGLTLLFVDLSGALKELAALSAS